MGGGSPSQSPSPVGSPRGHNIEGDLTNALNNGRIQPSDPGSSATAAAAMPTIFCGYPPFSGFPSPHHKHKLKCHFKIKHRHHGPPKIKHILHEHIKIIKHKHHKHNHGGEKEKHRFTHCHHMSTEAPLGCRFLHQGPHHHGPHPPAHPPHHRMRERRHHGHCCSHGYHHFFTGPMCGPGPVPVAVPVSPTHN
ncbi:hypothetical protein SUGI_0211460 [Cryptomeria japonica]|nr:hypothetical protein SUGI_0211460 [Cryptomeria japonica]